MTDKKFYEMNRQERLEFLKMSTGAGDIESSLQPLPFESASRMVARSGAPTPVQQVVMRITPILTSNVCRRFDA